MCWFQHGNFNVVTFSQRISDFFVLSQKKLLRFNLIIFKRCFSQHKSGLSGDCIIRQFLFTDWSQEAVSKAEILRLIYQGRFLHSNVTLGALGLPFGKTTVMHLVPRENLPEPNSQGLFFMNYECILIYVINFLFVLLDQRQKSKGGNSSCCSTSCCIL